jgi:HicB family
MTIYLRTTKELHRWLTLQAKKNNRSLNQEVEYRLKQQREAGESKPLIDELRELLKEAKKK